VETGRSVNIPGLEKYLNGRWTEQSEYFERKARANQKLYLRWPRIMLMASLATPITIFAALLLTTTHPDVPEWHWAELLLIFVSGLAIFAYQWEELHNYGAQWAKFRIVAERLKGHRQLFELKSGIYKDLAPDAALHQFIEYCEGLIEGTDVNYFVLMVDPLRKESR